MVPKPIGLSLKQEEDQRNVLKSIFFRRVKELLDNQSARPPDIDFYVPTKLDREVF